MAKVLPSCILVFMICTFLVGQSTERGKGLRNRPTSQVPVRMASEFMLDEISGGKVSLSQFRGRIVLLNFWATSCAACIIELPWLVDLDRRYRTRGLSIVGVDVYKENKETVRSASQKWHISYPLAIGNDLIVRDYELKEIPVIVLIDRAGHVAFSYVGVLDRVKFEAKLRTLMSQK